MIKFLPMSPKIILSQMCLSVFVFYELDVLDLTGNKFMSILQAY